MFYIFLLYISRSTLLQIVFLMADLDRGMSLLKTCGILKTTGIITSMIRLFKKYAIVQENEKAEEMTNKLTFVEEILVLNIILKVLLNDNKSMGDFISNGGIELLLQIYELGESKRYLDDVILNIFAYGLKDINYCDTIEEALKKVDFGYILNII